MVKQHGVGKAISLVRGWTGCTSFRPDRNTYSRAGEGHRSQAASERRERSGSDGNIEAKHQRRERAETNKAAQSSKWSERNAYVSERQHVSEEGAKKSAERRFGVMKVLG